MVTLVVMADTHGFHSGYDVPAGDILIHAGDLTRTGSLDELDETNHFLGSLPHEHKLVIAGNHDFCCERQPEIARAHLGAVTYLRDASIELCGLRFYGSPWQPEFFAFAFNLPRGAQLAAKWAAIPDDTDVLITHGPPAGFGDRTWNGERPGCADLLDRVREVQPRLHLFGHIHEDRGQWIEGKTTFVNVTTNECEHPPTVLVLEV